MLGLKSVRLLLQAGQRMGFACGLALTHLINRYQVYGSFDRVSLKVPPMDRGEPDVLAVERCRSSLWVSEHGVEQSASDQLSMT